MMIRSILLSSIVCFSAISTFAQTPSPTPACECSAEKAAVARLQTRLTDFGSLARYREANAKLAPPKKGEERVVFYGDSITDFWKLDEYSPGKGYINRGISGQSTYHMLLRFRQDVIGLKPKVVVILAGTNDIASTTEQFKLETIKSNILSIVDLAHAHNINVVIASLVPVSDYNKWPDGRQRIRTDARPAEMLKEINVWFREMARERGLVFIDYYAATVDEKGFLKADASNDGLHPNDNGYRLMKPLVEDGIKAALKQKQKPLR